MNIAWYTHYFTPEIGAPSARIYDFSQAWSAMQRAVQVVTCFPNHPTGRLYPGYRRGWYMAESIDGITVHRNRTYITPNKGFLKKTAGHVSYLPSAVLFSSGRMQKPDVAIGSSPTFFAAMAAAWAGKCFRIPFIMEVRDLWPAIFVELGVLRNRRMIRWLEMIEMTLYRLSTRVVTVTEAFRRNLIERGIPAEKVHTIPNGADTNYWQPVSHSAELRKKIGVNNDFVVLYIGAHGISQSLGRILETAVRLKDRSDIRFVFVGEGAEKDELVSKACNMGLQNVIFHDPVDKEGVREFYSIADVCLVPLRNIPLFNTFIPSKMFEIMSMERPMVASVGGEAADILKKSQAAMVVNPEDSQAIANAILSLYADKNHRTTMGSNGRRFVMDNYSRRSLADRYMEVMQSAIHAYGKKR